MGVVISGKYEGGRIKLSSKHKCLYIKCEKQVVPLDSARVGKYHLKEIEINPYTFYDRVYSIEWTDGSKSVVGIEKPNMTWFISGCETCLLTQEDINDLENSRNWLIWLMIIGTIWILTVCLQDLLLDDDKSYQDTPVQTTQQEDIAPQSTDEATTEETSSSDGGENNTDLSQPTTEQEPPLGSIVSHEISQNFSSNYNANDEYLYDFTDKNDELKVCVYREKYGNITPEELAGNDPVVTQLKQQWDELRSKIHNYDPQYAHDHRDEYIADELLSRELYSKYSKELADKTSTYRQELELCN